MRFARSDLTRSTHPSGGGGFNRFAHSAGPSQGGLFGCWAVGTVGLLGAEIGPKITKNHPEMIQNRPKKCQNHPKTEKTDKKQKKGDQRRQKKHHRQCVADHLGRFWGLFGAPKGARN